MFVYYSDLSLTFSHGAHTQTHMHPSSLPHTLGDKLSVLYKEKEKMYRSWRSKKDRAASCAVSSGERVKRPVLRFHIVEETTRIVLFGTFDRHTSVSLYIILH